MKKILIIEDNTEVREVLEEVLEVSGYEVISAEDGTVGVKAALEHSPDAIICDVMMPKLDGYGVLSLLSKKTQTADIPFIFLTAKAEKEDLRRGMMLGADDYITKPFYKDELLRVIETRLEKRARLEKKFDKTEEGLRAFIDEARGFEALKELSTQKRKETLTAKSELFLEGEYPRYLYFVERGKMKLFKMSDHGKEHIIDIRPAGTFIGYTSLINNENYNFSASAIEDTTLSLIPRLDFMKLLYGNRDVAAQLIKMLAGNVTKKEEQLLNLAYNSVRKRVANAILELYQNYEQQDNIPLLRKDLAGMVGTARESVIRVLAEFKEEGLISLNYGSISILEPKKLANVPG